MSAYVLAEIEMLDPQRYEDYKALAPAAIARYGGRYLVRGGETVTLEGNWKPGRIVLLEFPTLEAARTFYDSPEYRAAREKRKGAASFKMLAVAGS